MKRMSERSARSCTRMRKGLPSEHDSRLARLRLVSLLLVCLLALSSHHLHNRSAIRRRNTASLRRAASYAIRNARIVTVSGPEIENGTIVIRDGKIEAVGANVSVPSGAQTIDGRGSVGLSGNDRRGHFDGPG